MWFRVDRGALETPLTSENSREDRRKNSTRVEDPLENDHFFTLEKVGL